MKNKTINTQQTKLKKKTATEKLRENPWIGSTYTLGLCVLILLVFFILNPIPNDFFMPNETISNETISNETSTIKILTPQDVCLQIHTFPSWIRGNEIMEGYTNFNNESSSNIINNLIKYDIYFVWHSKCSVCVKQKELFGNEWQRYIDSGHTIQCG